MISKILILAVSILLLQSCASKTIADLRKNAAVKRSYDVNFDYQTVHRRLTEKIRNCSDSGFFFSPQASMVTDSAIYPDLGEGEISLRLINMGSSYYINIVVKKINLTTSHIDSYAEFSTYKKYMEKIEKWANNEETSCPL